jgi:hypothetical protein
MYDAEHSRNCFSIIACVSSKCYFKQVCFPYIKSEPWLFAKFRGVQEFYSWSKLSTILFECDVFFTTTYSKHVIALSLKHQAESVTAPRLKTRTLING